LLIKHTQRVPAKAFSFLCQPRGISGGRTGDAKAVNELSAQGFISARKKKNVGEKRWEISPWGKPTV